MLRTLAAATVIAAGACHGQELRLRYAEFDPMVATPGVPGVLSASAESRLRIVQFDAPPSEGVTAAARASGLRIHRILHEHAVIGSIDPALGTDLGAVERVRWSGPFHPAYKLEGSLLTRAALGRGAGERAAAPARVSIELFERGLEAQQRVAGAIESLGGLVHVTTPGGFRMEATLTGEQLLAVARMDEVHFIDPWGPPGKDMDFVRQFVGAEFLRTSFGFEGTGVRGEVMDTGIDVMRPVWRNAPILHSNGATGPSMSHGENVFAIAFGDHATQGGIAPDAQGVFFQYQECSTFGGNKPFADILAEAIDPIGPYRVDFFTASVGNPRTTRYTTISAETDDAVLRSPLMVVWTTGSLPSQDFRPEAWAKNVVSVGGVVTQRTLDRLDDTHGQTCIGPAEDGRIAPTFTSAEDIIQTAVGQFGAGSSTAPQVAACFGLLHQMWHEGLYPGFGGGATVFDDRPQPTTARAVMATGAYRYDWNAGGPNASLDRMSQGWGAPDFEKLAALAPKTFAVDETDALEHGDSAQYEVLVRPGEPELLISMAYLDPMGVPSATMHRINNLSLLVTSPSGEAYWGNAGLVDSNASAAGGAEDELNPQENVFIPSPESGAWTIEVLGTEILEDAKLETPEVDADFGLAAAGVAICPADCDTGSGVNVLDIFDFLCFQDAFVAGEGYADCDGNTSLDIFDFLCFQDAFVAGCPQ